MNYILAVKIEIILVIVFYHSDRFLSKARLLHKSVNTGKPNC